MSPLPADPELGLPADALVGPGFGTEILPEGSGDTVGSGGWYTVSPDGEVGDQNTDSSRGSRSSGASAFGPSNIANDMIRNQVFIGFGLIAFLAALLAFLFFRRKRKEKAEGTRDAAFLAQGVHRAISDTNVADDTAVPTEPDLERLEELEVKEQDREPAESKPSHEPEVEPISAVPVAMDKGDRSDKKPEPTKSKLKSKPAAKVATKSISATEAVRVDLSLEITSATRSVMMFSVDFRLDVCNRSDQAVRDLHIAAQLSCAQRSGSNAASIATGQPIAEINRIGPQQSRPVTGQLQLPLRELKTIQQGSKPLFIPLLHIILEGSGQKVITRSFVLGTPSATSQTRVHPLALDGPPGSLPPLRAQLIKQPDVKAEPATA